MAAETPLGVVGEKLTETATKQIFDTANKIVKSKLKLDKTEEKIQLKVEQGKTEKTQTTGRPGIQAAGILESGLFESDFTTKFCCKISRNRTAKMWSCFYMLKIGKKRKRR